MALADLAKFDPNEPVSLRDISLRQGISLDYFRTNFFKIEKKRDCSKRKRKSRRICSR